ncbi:alpha/beta hydrolase [Streptomyces sp. NPDC026673]|uniref:alpha/beta hydrolase n=1 Tax=Streptomyces sp. NPDC026673 TaxID=3155724 RepID=UPI0033DD3FE7
MTAARTTARIRSRRLRGVLATLGASALVLAACTTTGPHRSPAALRPAADAARGAGGTAPPDSVPTALRPYYEQKLTWRPCPVAAFQCTEVRVPLDYAHPEAQDITLTAIRTKATGAGGAARIGSLQFNPGGPGASAVEALLASVEEFSPALRAAYDLVAVDPRGVGLSTSVNCATDTPAVSLGRGMRMPDVDVATLEATDEANREVAEACEEHAGALLPHVGTVDAARDMDIMRALLGDERLHYLGLSYGTYLGTTYADLFPSRVGHLVLDGGVDPSIDGYQSMLNQAGGFQLAWESFAADCAARPDCPLGHSVAEAGRTLDALRDTLDRTPLRQGKDVIVTGDSITYTVQQGLMYPGSAKPPAYPQWAELRGVLAGVLEGDTTALQRFVGSAEEDNDPGDQSFLAVHCLTAALGPRSTPAQVQSALPRFLRASPQFGTHWATQLMNCVHWPVPANQHPHRVTAPGAAPILVIGTLRDPATPYVEAQSLVRQLSSGHLLTWDGEGHAAFQRGSACVDRAVDAYLTQDRIPPAGTVCD